MKKFKKLCKVISLLIICTFLFGLIPSTVTAVNPTIRVLAIGNSFSRDASWYISSLAQSSGYNIEFGYLYYPGCTLEQHDTFRTSSDEATRKSYSFYYIAADGTRTTVSTAYSLDEALSNYTWDVITLQQGSTVSGVASSYEPFLTNLTAFIKTKSSAPIGLVETWAYCATNLSGGNLTAWNTYYGANQMTMYNTTKSANITAKANNSDIKFIIPTGTAFQIARVRVGDTENNNGKPGISESDGVHAGTFGQYLASACYVAKLASFMSVGDSNFLNSTWLTNSGGANALGMTSAEATALQHSVYDAMNGVSPTSVTDYIVNQPPVQLTEKTNLLRLSGVTGSGVMVSKASLSTSSIAMLYSSSVFDSTKVAAMINGDTSTHVDASSWADWALGAVYDLGATYPLGSLKIYSGISGYPDGNYTVIALDSMPSSSGGTYYINSSKVIYSVTGSTNNPAEFTLPSSVSARYVIFLMTTYDGQTRPKEFEVYNYVEETEPEPEPTPTAINLLKESGVIGKGISGSRSGLAGAAPSFKYSTTGFSDTKVAAMIDGNSSLHVDVPYYTDWAFGAIYDLGAVKNIGKINIYSGISGYPDGTYKVFALTSLPTASGGFYTISTSNLIWDCSGSTTQFTSKTLSSAVQAQYILIFMMNAGDTRPKEFEVFDYVGSTGPDLTAEVNLLKTVSGVTGQGTLSWRSTMSTAPSFKINSSLFSSTKVTAMTDGNTASHVDVSYWGDWVGGVLYDLGSSYDIGKIRIFSGYPAPGAYPDGDYAVYGFSSLPTISGDTYNFSPSNLIWSCTGSVAQPTTATFSSPVSARYLLILMNNTSAMRPKEFEVYNYVAPENLLEPHNVLSDKGVPRSGVTATSIMQNKATGDVITGSQFEPAFATLVDESTTNFATVNADANYYLGVLYTLPDDYKISSFKAVAGSTGNINQVRIYASDNIDTLYNSTSIILDTTGTSDSNLARSVTLSNETHYKYIAFLLTDNTSGYIPIEFQATGHKFVRRAGDITGDDNINLYDMIKAKNILLGKLSVTNFSMSVLDMNNDTIFNILDALLLKDASLSA